MVITEINKSKSIKDMQGLIFIDCWEMPSLINFYQQLEQKIEFNQYTSMVVANYELALDSKDQIQCNTLEMYKHSNQELMLLPMLYEFGHRETSTWLQSKFKSHSVLLLTTESLQHHIETVVPHVTDWLVVGGTWQSCTHSRPIGFANLQKLPYNFYITDWSMYNIIGEFDNPDAIVNTATSKQFEKDSYTWIDQGNNLYRLQHNDPR